MKNKSILVVDDEAKIRHLVRMYLEREGYSVEEAVDGEGALKLFNQKKWDLVILDVMMPKLDGVEVCKEIRINSRVPVIMLTARNEEIDRVLGLEMGADDYIGKPFSPRELMARVKAVLRRVEPAEDNKQTTIIYPGITINLLTREVTIKGKDIYLTPKEFELLAIMARNPGRAYTREQLLELVWGFDYYGDLRTVDTHINRLREKIKVPKGPQHINTVGGLVINLR